MTWETLPKSRLPAYIRSCELYKLVKTPEIYSDFNGWRSNTCHAF